MSELLNQDLLQSSLSQSRPREAPYSARAGFLVSFFGGPPAACVLAALNAHRIGRLRRDLPWLAAAAMAYVGLQSWLALTAAGHQAAAALRDVMGGRADNLTHRLLGLVVFGLLSLLHRREQRVATLMGLNRPNGTWLGLGLIALGIVLSTLLKQVLQ